MNPASRWRDSARRIATLAWPMFVGQLAVLAFSTIDTLLVARHSALDLAALAVGAATYITVFIGLMGVVTSLAPIVGQLYGAGRLHEAGHQLHQAVWIALGLSVLGCTALAWPEPFLALSRAGPQLRPRIEAYLQALAWALPAALLFAAWRGFNVAVSRPKQVMRLQLAGLAVKLPLSLLLVRGVELDSPWGPIQSPALGVAGCGIATALAMWAQVAGAVWQLRRDDFYRRFAILGHGLHAPDRQALAAQLRLGIPSGLSVLIDVTGFAFMAIFIARLGAHTVAGHQIVANLAALLFMLPLALGHATSTLVAQRVGASDLVDARRLGWHGLQTAGGLALLAGLGRAAAAGTHRSAVHTGRPGGQRRGRAAAVDARLPLRRRPAGGGQRGAARLARGPGADADPCGGPLGRRPERWLPAGLRPLGQARRLACPGGRRRGAGLLGRRQCRAAAGRPGAHRLPGLDARAHAATRALSRTGFTAAGESRSSCRRPRGP
jgi:MATE family multidrug resistance protein